LKKKSGFGKLLYIKYLKKNLKHYEKFVIHHRGNTGNHLGIEFSCLSRYQRYHSHSISYRRDCYYSWRNPAGLAKYKFRVFIDLLIIIYKN
jgi:hypothetical protein